MSAGCLISNSTQGQELAALSQPIKTNPTLYNVHIWGNKFEEATYVAYSDLIQMGCINPDNTDVEPLMVDRQGYLAEVSRGL